MPTEAKRKSFAMPSHDLAAAMFELLTAAELRAAWWLFFAANIGDGPARTKDGRGLRLRRGEVAMARATLATESGSGEGPAHHAIRKLKAAGLLLELKLNEPAEEKDRRKIGSCVGFDRRVRVYFWSRYDDFQESAEPKDRVDRAPVGREDRRGPETPAISPASATLRSVDTTTTTTTTTAVPAGDDPSDSVSEANGRMEAKRRRLNAEAAYRAELRVGRGGGAAPELVVPSAEPLIIVPEPAQARTTPLESVRQELGGAPWALKARIQSAEVVGDQLHLVVADPSTSVDLQHLFGGDLGRAARRLGAVGYQLEAAAPAVALWRPSRQLVAVSA